jgi:hypothetical protein
MRVFLCVLAVMLSNHYPANAQEPIPTEIRDVERKVGDLEKKFEIEKTELSNIKSSVDELKAYLKAAGIAFSILAGLVTIYTLINLIRESRRAKANESRERAVNDRETAMKSMIDLYVVGESASQKRAGELHNVMLREGETTLKLVNETLSLAKDASKGATEALEKSIKALDKRVGQQLIRLDREISLFVRDFVNTDDRTIVNKRDNRDKLKLIVQKLIAFEYNNAVLAEPIPLTPNCLFIKAMQYYFDEQYFSIIETLQELVSRPDVDRDFKIYSKHWIGYEQNNIGDFARAEQSFISAISEAGEGERKLMLERFRIETMLFDRSRYKATGLIDNIDRALDACHQTDCSDESKALMSLTKGNILWAASWEVYNEGRGDKVQAREYMRQAALSVQYLAAEGSPIAERDWAFACYALQENLDIAKRLLADKVRKHARDEVVNRVGQRHKALYTLIQIMVAKTLNQEERVPALEARTVGYVSNSHPRIMLYSPLKRRNVKAEEFLNEVRSISDNGVPILA